VYEQIPADASGDPAAEGGEGEEGGCGCRLIGWRDLDELILLTTARG
jgi:hypothetical protein